MKLRSHNTISRNPLTWHKNIADIYLHHSPITQHKLTNIDKHNWMLLNTWFIHITSVFWGVITLLLNWCHFYDHILFYNPYRLLHISYISPLTVIVFYLKPLHTCGVWNCDFISIFGVELIRGQIWLFSWHCFVGQWESWIN